jgi:hypothetical protein
MSITPFDDNGLPTADIVYTMDDALRDGTVVLLAEFDQEVNGQPLPPRRLVGTRAVEHLLGGDGMRSVFDEFVRWHNTTRLTLPPEERFIYEAKHNGRAIWVVDSPEGYTMMLREEY